MTTDGPTRDAHLPAWPRARTPLRIALLGWARLSNQAVEGSGYNLSASELARGLALSGHEVFYLASGMRYSLLRGPRVRELETWGGVRCFELRNSPNLSPASSNFRNMSTEMSCPRQSALVIAWLRAVRAQVVHIHSLEGFGLDLIRAVRDAGIPVVVTPHNYWYVCPQVDLLHEEQRVCRDYDGGSRCVGCLPAPAPGRIKALRSVGQTLEFLLGLKAADAVRKFVYALPVAAKSALRGRLVAAWRPPIINPDRLADPELGAGFEPPPGSDGTIDHGFRSAPGEAPAPPPPFACADDENERFLRARDVHLRVVHPYGQRRRAGVDALNHASLITTPSAFLRRVHAAMGVDEQRLRWVRLGQPHFDQIHRATRRASWYDTIPWTPDDPRPLRLAFFGTTRANKGLEVFVRAIEALDPAVRRRCRFIIRALGNEVPVRRRLSRFPEASVFGGFDLVQLISLGGEYDVGVLPHIWFENSPLVMLEHLHAGKFVLSSRLGGPVDWIVEPGVNPHHPLGNGLLFTAGRPDALARDITRLVHAEVRLPTPRQVHAASVLRSYPDHVRELEGVYAEVLGHAPAHTPRVVVRAPGEAAPVS